MDLALLQSFKSRFKCLLEDIL